jgi:hypothetical protein
VRVLALMVAMPTLAVMNTSPWLSGSGSRNTSSSRSAMSTDDPSADSGSSTTYSSPDSRDTIADAGAAWTSRSATVRST